MYRFFLIIHLDHFLTFNAFNLLFKLSHSRSKLTIIKSNYYKKDLNNFALLTLKMSNKIKDHDELNLKIK